MTLGESGKWYREQFATTPAAAMVAKGAWKRPELSSVWYYSSAYRVNLMMESGVVRIRDMYVFDENYPEHYLDRRCDTHACEFRNLPVMDGAVYSDPQKDLIAGIYFTAKGRRIVWDDMDYAEPTVGVATVTLTCREGRAVLTLEEGGFSIETDIDGFTLVPVYDRARVLGIVDDSDKLANSNNSKTNLSFIEKATFQDREIAFRMNSFDYAIRVVEGVLGEDLSVAAEKGKLSIRMM